MSTKAKKVKQPAKNGVARTPVIMQLEALECGAACLAMVMAYYGKWVPLEKVRLDCGVSRDGSKAKNICLAAKGYGLEVKAYRAEPRELKRECIFPCIIHWNMNHFIVLNGFKGNYAYINDPARGRLKVSSEEFDDAFTGIVIVPVPSEDFVTDGERRSTLSFALRRLYEAKRALLFVILTTVIGYLFGIVNSVTSRVFMDRLLTGINRGWLKNFTYLLIFLAILQIISEWIRTIYSLRINGKMAAVGSASYMWKVMKLPMEFFLQRNAGDIEGRLMLNASLSETIVGIFAPLLINSAMMIFYLILMLKASPLLTVVGIAAFLTNILLSGIISEKRMNIARVQVRDSGKLESLTVTGIEMMETIKASGAENGFFNKWAGYQASVNAKQVEAVRLNQLLGAVPSLLIKIANYTVLILGVFKVMEGEFTLGAVLMFQGFLSSFMQPAGILIGQGQALWEMRTQMERIEDVMKYPEDEVFSDSAGTGELHKLKGNIELKNITFGYSRLDKPLLENFSLNIRQGERIAIVGASGCGKSTVSKLISGINKPWSGEILFDGKTRSEYPREVMTGSIAVVDQDIILFEDSISENIRLWDESIRDFEVILAARDAQLHDDIMRMPGGYSHMLTSDGRSLSGGQRQRLEIARVLAQDPTVVILDEATSALDAGTEADVVNAIRERGITVIVIAHRLSTVRTCDEIVVLDNGSIRERGTHEELMKRGGLYAELISCE